MKVAKQTFKFFVLLSMLFTSAFVMVDTTINDGKSDGGQVDTKKEVEDYILHHIQDSHDFSLFSYTSDEGERKHVGFPLPVILFSS